MIRKLPFGRLMLFFLITAILFGVFSLFRLLNPFFDFYWVIAGFSLMGSAVCLVLWMIITLFIPKTLFEPGRSLSNIKWLNRFFRDVPYIRIAILSLVISITLFWVHKLVFPIGFTVFLMSLEMLLVRLLFFIYGSA